METMEGIAISALVLALVGWGMFAFLWLMIGILEEKVSKTIDEHGVIRKQYLPGEVFAVPAMAKGEGGASEARMKEMEDQLTRAKSEVKAMKMEMKELEDKLRAVQDKARQDASARTQARDMMGGSQPMPNGAVDARQQQQHSREPLPSATSGGGGVAGGAPPHRNSELAGTQQNIIPEPVTFVRKVEGVSRAPAHPSDAAFSLMADIGFTTESGPATPGTKSDFAPGSHRKPPSLYGPTAPPARSSTLQGDGAAMPSMGGGMNPWGDHVVHTPKLTHPDEYSPSKGLQQQQQQGQQGQEQHGQQQHSQQVGVKAQQAGAELNMGSNADSAFLGGLQASGVKGPNTNAVGGGGFQAAAVSPMMGLQASGVKASRQQDRQVEQGLPSPTASLTPSRISTTDASKKPFVQHATALSARGINPEKHPELHAKEMSEMRKLLDMHCGDSAELVDRTAVRCLWCREVISCPPYRPQSFFFKDVSSGGVHDGHFWTCQQNPNVTLQAGRGVNVGEGKVLI